MNALITNIAELKPERVRMLATKNHVESMHCVMQHVMLQSASVLPATKEIQKFNAVSVD